MCSMQLVWCAHLTSSWGISFCCSVHSLRVTRSAPGYCEPCFRFVWVRVWGWWSHFQWGNPDFRTNSRSSRGYHGWLVFICMLWDLSCVFWNNFVRLRLRPFGDAPSRSENSDLSTEVEIDMPDSKRRAVVTRRLNPFAGDPGGLHAQVCLCWDAVMNSLSRHLKMVWWFSKCVSV